MSTLWIVLLVHSVGDIYETYLGSPNLLLIQKMNIRLSTPDRERFLLGLCNLQSLWYQSIICTK